MQSGKTPLFSRSKSEKILGYKPSYSNYLRFDNNFSAYKTISLSINIHVQNMRAWKLSAKKSKESFDTGIVKKLRQFK